MTKAYAKLKVASQHQNGLKQINFLKLLKILEMTKKKKETRGGFKPPLFTLQRSEGMKLKPHKIYESFAEAMAAIFLHPPGEAQVMPYNGKWVILKRGAK